MGRKERHDVDYFINEAKATLKKINKEWRWFYKKFKRPHLSRRIKGEVYIRDSGKCIQCGQFLPILSKKLNLKEGVYHHIIPLVYGGASEAYNICLLCIACHLIVHSGRENSEKYYKSFSLWASTGKIFEGDLNAVP